MNEDTREKTRWVTTEDAQGNPIRIRAVWDYEEGPETAFVFEKRRDGEDRVSQWNAREVLMRARDDKAGRAVWQLEEDLEEQMAANNGEDEDYQTVCRIAFEASEARDTGASFFGHRD